MNFDSNFWKEIKEKYPKSYNLFFNKYKTYAIITDDNGYPETDGEAYIDISRLCYCDIEKFFDDNGIEIYILKQDFRLGFYCINILHKNNVNNGFIHNQTIESRPEAKEQAIYKAFEILEGKSWGEE